MINRVVLVGRLTRDPELTYTPSGIAKVRFTIAVNRSFSNGNGEREADFVSCIAWRKQAENLANFQKKGNLIGVEGRIQTGSYESQDGKRIFTTDIVADSIQFLESKNNRSNQQESPQQQPQQQQQNYHNKPIPEESANHNFDQRMEEYRRMQEQAASNNSFPPSQPQTESTLEDDLPF